MCNYPIRVIKSFKHNGHLHRMWLENWLVPASKLHPDHADQSMQVLINSQTRIQESDGNEWVSKVPSISFFIPNQWYNIVALIEETGIRYYCNIASPYYRHGETITYIDYDLDVIVMPDGQYMLVDQDEYELHKVKYFYSNLVDQKVQSGLSALMGLIKSNKQPFQDDVIYRYYADWKKSRDIIN
jgi:protein associated with RNAse G/E